MLSYISMCECGLKRDINQDRAGAFVAGNKGLFYVADGMGGHYAGELASECVRQSLQQLWDSSFFETNVSLHERIDLFKSILSRINTQILETTPSGKRCGTTVVLLWVEDYQYGLLSIGDSRCYLTHKNWPYPKVYQLTVDDVVPRGNADSGKLYRALGTHRECLLRVRSGRLENGAVLILCTDGVYKVCPTTLLYRNLRITYRHGNLSQSAELLQRSIIKRGAPDNYSLVMVRQTNEG